MKKNHLLNLFLATLVIVSAVAAFVYNSDNAGASVTYGNDYKSVEITSTNASSSPIIIKAGVGTLGSIIISSTTANTYFRVWDNAVATSSATSTRIASFPVSATAGTYTFDREIQKGLIIEAPAGFAGSYTVTYR